MGRRTLGSLFLKSLSRGGDGDDSLDAFFRSSGDNTLNGGAGIDELLILSYYSPSVTSSIITSLDASTTSGTITVGSNSVTFSSIEQFNIFGTESSDMLTGGNGNDTLIGGYGGNDSVSGGAGTDALIVNYYSATSGITTTLDASTTSGTITAGSSSVTFSSIEQFNIFELTLMTLSLVVMVTILSMVGMATTSSLVVMVTILSMVGMATTSSLVVMAQTVLPSLIRKKGLTRLPISQLVKVTRFLSLPLPTA